MSKRDLGFDDADICRKLETIPGFHLYISEINSKHQSSFLFSLKVELMLVLAVLNRLKSFRWYFLMVANNWIHWKAEFLRHVNKKHNNKFDWYAKVSILLSTGNSLLYILSQPFSTTCKHHYKIISQGNGKFQDWGGCMWE